MEGLLQPTHLIFVLVIVLIIFGGRKLPELGRGLGTCISELKQAMRGNGETDSDKKPDKGN
jgi:sec-independent protein translocase protein TatA